MIPAYSSMNGFAGLQSILCRSTSSTWKKPTVAFISTVMRMGRSAPRSMLHVLDGGSRVLVDVTHSRFGCDHHGDSGAAFLHVTSVSNEDQARLQGVDPLGGHMAHNALHRQGAHHDATPHVIPIEPGKDPVHDGEGNPHSVVLMIGAANGHADVMQHARQEEGHKAVLVGARVIRLQAERDARAVHQLRHDEGVEHDGAHVHRSVVVVSQPFYGDDVRIFLKMLDLLVIQEDVRGRSWDAAQAGADLVFKSDLFG